MHRKLPSSAKHKKVHAAVVVIVRLNDIQTTQLIGDMSLGGTVRKSSVSIVVVEAQRLTRIETRKDDVEKTVIVKIIDDNAASFRKRVQSCRCSDICKTANIFLRFKY